MSTPTPNRATTTRPERSSRRTARRSPLGWLPWALLGLLGLLLALTILVINAVDDDGADGPSGDSLGQVDSGGSGLDGQDGDGQVAGTEEEAPEGGSDGSSDGAAEGSEGAAPDAGASGGGASLTADGEDLLAAATAGGLAERSGQAVTGSARVESVVSDEGFWVGSSAEERVFVFLTPEARESQGESAFQVEAGQTVQLEGALTPLDESPEVAEGVTADEGAEQLTSQGAYVRADSVTLA